VDDPLLQFDQFDMQSGEFALIKFRLQLFSLFLAAAFLRSLFAFGFFWRAHLNGLPHEKLPGGGQIACRPELISD